MSDNETCYLPLVYSVNHTLTNYWICTSTVLYTVCAGHKSIMVVIRSIIHMIHDNMNIKSLGAFMDDAQAERLHSLALTGTYWH